MRIGSPSSSNIYPSATSTSTSQGTGRSFAIELADSKSARESDVTYDFTNMSQEEMQSAMGDLYKSGKMSFDEISLAVPMIQSPLAKVNVDGGWPDAYSQPMNFVSTLNSGLDSAKSQGDIEGVKNITQLMNALQRNQAMQKG